MMAAPLVNLASSVSAQPREKRDWRQWLRGIAAKIVPSERVATCGQRALASAVNVNHGPQGGHYAGLETCSSVWLCPVCAAKISEQRRRDVKTAIDRHIETGGTVYMAAFTMPHHRFQAAALLKAAVAGTFRALIAGRLWRRAKQEVGLVGFIRALEITHGENGWHPHIHVLFFLPAHVNHDRLAAFSRFLFARWRGIIARKGFGDCNPNIWQFELARSSEAAGDYVAKWGADREITSGHTKSAKGGGRSPWQLLEAAGRRDPVAVMAFREYAAAFKGARQLTWSRGLKALCGVVEVSDDEAVKAAEEASFTVAQITARQFMEMCKRHLDLALLQAVEADPSPGTVQRFLREHRLVEC